MDYVPNLFYEIATIQESIETLRHDGDIKNIVSIKLLRMHQVKKARQITNIIDQAEAVVKSMEEFIVREEQ